MYKTFKLLLFTLVLSGVHAAKAHDIYGDDIRALVAPHVDGGLSLFREFLSLPNDAHYQDDIAKLLTYMDGKFRDRNFKTEIIENGGSPALFATRMVPDAKRTILIYLQADGQPIDPALWDQDHPFKPVLKEKQADGSFAIIPWNRLQGERDMDWRIFARSASDSKGPMTQFLTAISALDAAGHGFKYNMKVIVDTEEEQGSPFLPSMVVQNREKFSADMMLIFDGPPHASNLPTLTFGARGIAEITLTTYGPHVPQHSGHYGNYAPNPVFPLAHMLGSMKDADGRVTIPGFYDGVSIDAKTKAILNTVPDDEQAINRHLGIPEPDAVGDSLQEAIQYPSLNVRGIQALKVGKEARTLIPDTAIAEIDIRLVKESNAERLISLVRDHISALGYTVIGHTPTLDERMQSRTLVTFTSSVSYSAFRTDFDSAPGLMARAGMKRLYGKEPILIRTMGGSIPISPFVETLDIPAVGVPTVNIDNNQHAPNENIRLGNFIEGMSIIAAVLMRTPE